MMPEPQTHVPQARHRRPLLKRGAVSATGDPLEVLWNGRRVPLSPLEATMLVTLLRRSRLRWHEAEAVLTQNGGRADSRDVLIHRIRRKFAEVGAGDPIETLRGWGIRFRTEADRQGNRSLWIGASEADDEAFYAASLSSTPRASNASSASTSTGRLMK